MKHWVSFKSSLKLILGKGMVMKTDNAQNEMTLGQLREFSIRVLAALPLDMPWEVAQGWIQNPKALAKVLSEALMPPKANVTDVNEILADWQRFYEKFFRIELDFSKINIPEKQQGFDRPIVIAKGLAPNKVFEKCQKHFPCWCYTEDLDKAASRNDREPTGHYAIWVRDRQEADEELKNLSAATLKEKNIKGVTLLERLIFELKYWDETGKHLDKKNVTLCAGSRNSDGTVPYAYWYDGKFEVDWFYPQDADPPLRARAVVSF